MSPALAIRPRDPARAPEDAGPSTIVVLFDGVDRAQFLRRLEWPFLVKAWSKAIRWERVGASRVRLELAGIDGLQTIQVTRRALGGKIFIAAHDMRGGLIQTGVWSFEDALGVCVCVRRVYRAELVETLRERLPDFIAATFLH